MSLRVFRRRKRHRDHGVAPQVEDDYYRWESSTGSVAETGTPVSRALRTLTRAVKYNFSFLMLLLVTFAFIQNRDLQQEVNYLRNTFAPPAFMMPNFALESMGKSSSSSLCLVMTHTCALMWTVLISNFVPLIFAGARVFHRLSSDSYFSPWSSGIVDRIFYYSLSPASRKTVLHVRPTQKLSSFY